MSKKLVIIIGPQAVGKMTVGQELEKITGFTLFHNHMSIELPCKLFGDCEKEFKILKETIRKTVFELFAKGDFEGLIFTYLCAYDVKEDVDYLINLVELFEKNGAVCSLVELSAEFEERISRNKSENRLKHKESKRNIEWSEADIRKTNEKHRLNSYDGEKLPFQNYLKIDNTNLSPEAVAKMIKEHFGL